MMEAGKPSIIGVEPFDAEYGAGFEPDSGGAEDIECAIVEGDGFQAHRPGKSAPPARLCFVDGVRRVEAHLTRSEGPEGGIVRGIAGAWGAGAVLVRNGRAGIDLVKTGRAVVFAHGVQVNLPDHGSGWRWRPFSVEGDEPDAPRLHLQNLIRDAEAEIEGRLSADGWLTVFDGPLHHRVRGASVIGYVKTHRRRTLALEDWRKVPSVGVGERSSLFALSSGVLACYVRVGNPGPWASPWAGIARIELPAAAGREAAISAADRAAGWLPAFASEPHRDPRAPVNLSPVATLERRLHHLLGDRRLALRAVREAVMAANRREG